MARNCKITLIILIFMASLASQAPPAASARITFTAAGPVTLHGRQSGRDQFTAGGIVKECPVAHFEGRLGGPSRTLKLGATYGHPLYSGCIAKALSGLRTKLGWVGCSYLLRPSGRIAGRERWRADVEISCPSQLALLWYVYTSGAKYNAGEPVCTTSMPSQTLPDSAELRNIGGSPGRIAIRWNLTGIRYTPYGSSLLCGPLRPRRDASYRGEAIIAAKDAGGKPVDLAIGG